VALHGGYEAVDDSASNVTEFIPSEVDKGLSRSGGEWRVWACSSGLVGVYIEWRWCNFLH
jgi:hypothetical protein